MSQVLFAQEPDGSADLGTLRDGSVEERSAAIARVRAVPMRQRSPDVLPVLLEELERIHAQRELQARLPQEQRSLESDSHSRAEYNIEVLKAVVEYKDDPVVIPYLIPHMSLGAPVMEALAGLGHPVVEPMLAIATSKSERSAQVNASLLVLRRMVENHEAAPIGDEVLEEIIGVASGRLVGRQEPTVAFAAVELAVATGDPALRRRVEEIARDLELAREVASPTDQAVRLQARARSALERRVSLED